MIDMEALLAFLRAQIDEDEKVAAATADWQSARIWPSWSARDDDGRGVTIVWSGTIYEVASRIADEPAAHIVRHDPARVLAEVDAKRRIIDAADGWQDSMTMADYFGDQPYEMLCLLALPYADRPGFDQRWLP